MAEHAMDMSLWEAICDGNLESAKLALEQGADPNRKYALSVDNYGRKAWDYSTGGSLPWRHVLITSDNMSGIWQPPTRGVPTTSVRASSGDTLLHIAVKLIWHELAALLSSMINIDESVENDDSQTAEEVAYELGGTRVMFYRRYFVGETTGADSTTTLVDRSNMSLSPMQYSRNEFKKSAMRSLVVEKRYKPNEFRNPNAPTHLAGYVEQELLQLEMSPAPNDETVIPRFPRSHRHNSPCYPSLLTHMHLSLPHIQRSARTCGVAY